MMIRKTLEIAGIKIALESEIPFGFAKNCQTFCVKNTDPDVLIHMERGNESSLKDFRLLSDHDGFRTFENEQEFIRVKYSDCQKTQISWCLRRNKEEINRFRFQFFSPWEVNIPSVSPFFFFSLSEFLIEHDAIILHSSVISYHGKGIVFTAPSQTGKSTQASLWEKYRGAEVLNGDRTIIRKQDQYRVYGSPYAGSSGIYKNKSAELTAIVVLRQAKENRIRRLGAKEACLCLMSEMSVCQADKHIVEKQTDWLLQLIREIPIYRLDCLPDQNAVELLHKELGDRIEK